jgi:hypothetical protein
VKEHKRRNTEFHTYKPQQKMSIRVVLKHIHAPVNLDDIKKEIGDIGDIEDILKIY